MVLFLLHFPKQGFVALPMATEILIQWLSPQKIFYSWFSFFLFLKPWNDSITSNFNFFFQNLRTTTQIVLVVLSFLFFIPDDSITAILTFKWLSLLPLFCIPDESITAILIFKWLSLLPLFCIMDEPPMLCNSVLALS